MEYAAKGPLVLAIDVGKAEGCGTENLPRGTTNLSLPAG